MAIKLFLDVLLAITAVINTTERGWAGHEGQKMNIICGRIRTGEVTSHVAL
jgi:hypothetical protein